MAKEIAQSSTKERKVEVEVPTIRRFSFMAAEKVMTNFLNVEHITCEALSKLMDRYTHSIVNQVKKK